MSEQEKKQEKPGKLEKELVREPAPEVVPRDDVKVGASPTRCPYCHDGIAPEAGEWVACESCLARHHSACWTEGGKCSTCGHARRLSSEPAPAKAAPPAQRRALVASLVACAIAVAVVPVIGRLQRVASVSQVQSGPQLTGRAKAEAEWKQAWGYLEVGDVTEFELEQQTLTRDGTATRTVTLHVTQTVIAKVEDSVTVRLEDLFGTKVVEIRRDGRAADPDERVIGSPEGDVRPDYVPARGILPLRVYRSNPLGPDGRPDEGVLFERYYAPDLGRPVLEIESHAGQGSTRTQIKKFTPRPRGHYDPTRPVKRD